MSSFLFVYNPKHWNWDDLNDEVGRLSSGESVRNTWSISAHKQVSVGDRAYLMRLGVEPKGIIGSGTIISEPFETEHWDPEKAKQGQTTFKVDIEFDRLGSEPILSDSILDSNPNLLDQTWHAQSSGIKIQNDIANALEDMLEEELNAITTPGLSEFLGTVLAEYQTDTQQRKQLPTKSYQAFKSVEQYLNQHPIISKNSDLIVDWSTGKGNWAKVPWLAVLDKRWTDSVQHGVYVVYLFREDMSGVYLTLNQGVTEILNKHGKREGYKILQSNAELLGRESSSLREFGFKLDDNIKLSDDSGLGQDYEHSTVAYKFYSADDVPAEGELLKDLNAVVRAYGEIPLDVFEPQAMNRVVDVLSNWLTNSQLKELLASYKEYGEDDQHVANVEQNIDLIKLKILSNPDIPDSELEELLRKSYKQVVQMAMYERNITENFSKVKSAIEEIREADAISHSLVDEILEPSGKYHVRGVNKSFWSLIFLAKDPEQYPYWNNKTNDALNFLGMIDTQSCTSGEAYLQIAAAFAGLKEMGGFDDLVPLDHFMHFVWASDERGKWMIRDWKMERAAELLVALIRKWKIFADWRGIDDEIFQSDEIEFKREACAEAQELLGEEAMSSLIEAGSWDEIIDRLNKIGHKTNLLWLSAPRTGDLAIIARSDELDKAAFCSEMYSLLHGSEPVDKRLGNYLSWVEEKELDNKWTFPTYFLYLLDPSSEIFIKPGVVKWMVEAFDLEVKYSSKPSVDFYMGIRDYCSRLIEVLSSYGAKDMLDIQSVIWIAYRAASATEKSARENLVKKYYLFDSNWAAECDIGYEYFWFPGQQVPLSGREELLGLTKGDVIVTYFGKNIKYAAEVNDYTRIEEAPPEISSLIESIGWVGIGYEAPLEGKILPNPINLKQLPEEVVDFISVMEEDEIIVREIPASLIEKIQEAHPTAGWPVGTLASNPRDLVAEWIGKIRHNTKEGVGRLYHKQALLIGLLDLLSGNPDHTNHFTMDEVYEYYRALSEREGDRKNIRSFRHPFEKLSHDVVPLRVWNVDDEGNASISSKVWPVFTTSDGRDYVRDLVMGDKGEVEDAEVIEMQEAIEIAPAMQTLIEDVSRKGFIYQPWQLATFVTAVRTKPFVILAGVTGTGKSKLPVIVSELTGGESRIIPVKPDWTDSSDVIGYTDLNNKFRSGELLKFARMASKNPNVFHTCIIDEMNIARVEHYFAEVLSRIEERERDSIHGGYRSGILVDSGEDAKSEVWENVRIPSNMAIVGTVNMDESTHGFSKKVLDRAFTIELSDIDLSKWHQDIQEIAGDFWPASTWYPQAIRLGELELDTEDRAHVDRVISVLVELNGILKHGQLQVGYRTRDEIALFCLNARDLTEYFVNDEGDTVDPLDLAIHMKVLPRIIGGGHAVKKVVRDLLLWAWDGTVGSKEPQTLVDIWNEAGCPESMNQAKYGRTAARLCLMYERFAEGFTSYWL